MHQQSKEEGFNSLNIVDRKKVHRDLALASAVGKLPDESMVGVEEVAALCRVAASSLRKPEQRARMSVPEPSPLGGRHLIWNLGDIRAWLLGSVNRSIPSPPPKRQPGRPKKKRSQIVAESTGTLRRPTH